VAGIMAHP